MDIHQALEHFKIRPTNVILNTIYISLKNEGYKNIPSIKFIGAGLVTKETIDNYCQEIENLIKKEPEKEIEVRKYQSSKDIHTFKESAFLPKNVYVQENDDDIDIEGLDDDIDIEGLDDESEETTSTVYDVSSVYSDQDLGNEGYEIYDSDEFSE